MEKKRAIELLIQEVDKIPYLKTLPSSNDEFRLWLKNVENIINTGLEPEDKNKYQEASQFLRYLRGVHEEGLIQQDYIDEIIRYEIALKSIIQKYEILWMEGKRDKGGDVEKMDKREAIGLLSQELDKASHLKEQKYDNQEFESWRYIVGDIIKTALDSEDHNRFSTAAGPSTKLSSTTPDSIQQEAYQRKLTKYETALKSIIQKYEMIGFETKPAAMAEPKDTAELPVFLFDKMQFHPKIIDASRALFKDEHYAQAIFEAFKAVENFVQDKSDLNLHGTKLMETVFNEENPIVKVPEAGHYYKDVQRGFKHLFVGAAQAIRNPKAHKKIIQKDPYITLQYLGFFSFLLKRIDYWEVGIS